jgi:uncharacterized protein YdeI (YjbR/CyaY-like superfamily)
MKPKFFPTPGDFRAWLEAHHATKTELLVGFHKKGSGRPSIAWPESVDEALCFGWIDGVRHSLTDAAYTIRFTPRKTTSTWSAVNVARVEELTKAGRMRPAGLRAFAARRADRTGVYSFERSRAAVLSKEQEKRLRSNRRASAFFDAQPPGYRRTAIHWIISAKRPETRERRLSQLIADSAAGRRIKPLARPARSRSPSEPSPPQAPCAPREARGDAPGSLDSTARPSTPAASAPRRAPRRRRSGESRPRRNRPAERA